MANDVTDALYAALCAMKIASGLPRVDAEYDFGPAIASVEAALAARPEPEGVETTVGKRAALLDQIKGLHSEGDISDGLMKVWGALFRDFDRLSAENASLKASLAEAEAEKGDITHLLAEAVDDGVHLRSVIREAKTEKAEAVKAEREACAKIAEEIVETYNEGVSAIDSRFAFTRGPRWKDGPFIAAAIRARGGSDALP